MLVPWSRLHAVPKPCSSPQFLPGTVFLAQTAPCPDLGRVTRARRGPRAGGHPGCRARGWGTLPWPGTTSLRTHRQDELILFSVSMATASFPSPFGLPAAQTRSCALPGQHPAPKGDSRDIGAMTQPGPLLRGLPGVAAPPAQNLQRGPNPAPLPRLQHGGDLGEQTAGLGTCVPPPRSRGHSPLFSPFLAPAVTSSRAGRGAA